MNSITGSVTVDHGRIQGNGWGALIELPIIALGCLVLWLVYIVGAIAGVAWYVLREVSGAIATLAVGAYWLAKGGDDDE